MKGFRVAIVAGAIVALVGSAITVEAAEYRVRCDYKKPNVKGKGERTRVRVDGHDVAEGTYTVTLNALYTDTATTVQDEDEFEFKTRFSSNRGHVAGGATRIPANLGAAGSATVEIAGPSGTPTTTTVNCPGRTTIDLD